MLTKCVVLNLTKEDLERLENEDLHIIFTVRDIIKEEEIRYNIHLGRKESKDCPYCKSEGRNESR